MLSFCAGCGAQSEGSGSGGMFSLFKKKGPAAAVTTVHPDVGAPLVRQSTFPAAPSSAEVRPPRELALKGDPPQASFVDDPIPEETTPAYIIDASAAHPPLAVVNVRSGQPRIEIWEVTSAGKPAFVRKRAGRLDPQQDSWTIFFHSGVAELPANRLLLGVYYYAPQVKEALYVYDTVKDSYAKIANVEPHNTFDRQKFFEARAVAPNAVIVQYFTGRIRLAPEVYYNTPSHLRLFSPRYPDGVDVLRLSADDGSIERWAVIDKTLWVMSSDQRQRNKPKNFIWSLNLGNVLP
jgi:hypothetical protein